MKDDKVNIEYILASKKIMDSFVPTIEDVWLINEDGELVKFTYIINGRDTHA